MTVRRLYAPDLPEAGGALTLGEAADRHARVLRLRAGDEVELFDGAGRSAKARIVSVAEAIQCETSPTVAADASGPRVLLMLGVPKGSTLDTCVRMATELGVDEVALMQAERSVPRWDEARARSRINRLTRIAAEAAAQSERAELPIIHGPAPFAEWIERVPPRAFGVVFGARAEGLLSITETPEQVWCAIGPEGGFSNGELEALKKAGFVAASLGRSILRVDTAVAAALTVVQDRLASLQPR
jgi:16S rRNA (uracil1498-N3)-methyltransferase